MCRGGRVTASGFLSAKGHKNKRCTVRGRLGVGLGICDLSQKKKKKEKTGKRREKRYYFQPDKENKKTRNEGEGSIGTLGIWPGKTPEILGNNKRVPNSARLEGGGKRGRLRFDRGRSTKMTNTKERGGGIVLT